MNTKRVRLPLSLTAAALFSLASFGTAPHAYPHSETAAPCSFAVALGCTASPAGQSRCDSITPQSLPLPTVPDSLHTVESRAAYVILHFWDALDFTTAPTDSQAAMIEQSFADYVSLFPYTDATTLSQATLGLLRRSQPNDALFLHLTGLAEKYLYNPNSPLYDEQYYGLFLQSLAQLPGLTDAQLDRPRYQLECIAKNAPGTEATDFRFTRPDSRTSRLRSAAGRPTLLFFYDAGCEHCAEALARMKADSNLQALVSADSLHVLAICVEGNTNLWREHLATLPATWTHGYVTPDFDNKALYVLRAMPTLYLLAPDQTVLLKDVPLDIILTAIQRPQ